MNRSTKQLFVHMFNTLVACCETINGMSDFDRHVKRIHKVSQIPTPNRSSWNDLPMEIQEEIVSTMNVSISYSFSLLHKKIKVQFVDETMASLKQYDKFMKRVLLWLLFVLPFASPACSQELSIFVYLTNHKKQLPNQPRSVHLDQEHVNSAYTFSCQRRNEIVIFRREEWFKVLIHESFHNLGLDFSNMNNQHCHRLILSMFPIASQVNLFEAYTEFWAEILNAVFVCFFSLEKKSKQTTLTLTLTLTLFLSRLEQAIALQQAFSCFQMVKVLNYMGLTYSQLYTPGMENQMARDYLYKEKTNVFAYYIVTTLLLNHYEAMLAWCTHNNYPDSLFAFKKTKRSQESFCGFIHDCYKSNEFLSQIDKEEKRLLDLKQRRLKNKEFLLKTMRMSLLETR